MFKSSIYLLVVDTHHDNTVVLILVIKKKYISFYCAADCASARNTLTTDSNANLSHNQKRKRERKIIIRKGKEENVYS